MINLAEQMFSRVQGLKLAEKTKDNQELQIDLLTDENQVGLIAIHIQDICGFCVGPVLVKESELHQQS